MKSKKKSDEKAQVIEIEIEGNLEDLLTEEELKQLEEDEYLDGGPGYIPTWSSCYKTKKITVFYIEINYKICLYMSFSFFGIC